MIEGILGSGRVEVRRSPGNFEVWELKNVSASFHLVAPCWGLVRGDALIALHGDALEYATADVVFANSAEGPCSVRSAGGAWSAIFVHGPTPFSRSPALVPYAEGRPADDLGGLFEDPSRDDEMLDRVASALDTPRVGPQAPPPRSSVVGRRLERARRRLVAELEAPPSLDELAREAHVSKAYFVRSFHAAFGLPPARYLMQARLVHARALLARGEPAIRVAGAAGFVDQSHLNRAFRRFLGLTPCAYARSMQA